MVRTTVLGVRAPKPWRRLLRRQGIEHFYMERMLMSEHITPRTVDNDASFSSGASAGSSPAGASFYPWTAPPDFMTDTPLVCFGPLPDNCDPEPPGLAFSRMAWAATVFCFVAAGSLFVWGYVVAKAAWGVQ